ncbi:FAD-dependent oxidoreductase [Aspergillus lucknowensis]|uniref:FAD-binding domain-containing protein n=1 Tax=Aspergillus lucknowensis TaxID=176173 RepID=A0ABR4LV41_9EURO
MGLLRRFSALIPRTRAAVAEPATTVTVLVVGAGSTGLALAQGLKKACLALSFFAGIPCIVVEKHEGLDAQPRDWNMGLHWGAESLKAVIPDEMWSRIQTTQVDPFSPTAAEDVLKFLNGQSGEILTAVPANNFYRLRRRKLRALLAEGLDVRYGMKLEQIEYAKDGKYATAFFRNGPSITASLIVGTDGARSATRRLLLGPELGSIRTLPYCATFVQARFTAEQARFLRQFHPLYLASINPAGYFAFFGMHDAPDPKRPETWTFFFYISWHSPLEEQKATSSWTNAQRLKQVKEFATKFTDPWKSAFAWIPDDHEVWYMSLTDFDPGAEGHRWDSHDGRVTLAGDAAHAMTYQRGQGLNHSVTDAAKLVVAIQEFFSGRKARGDAIRKYEEEMISRAGGEVRMSTTNTEMVHDWQKVLASPIMTQGMTKVQDIDDKSVN